MHKLLALIFALLFLVSCKPILLKMYGIKDPEVENEKTVKKKALKFGLDTANIVTVNCKDFPLVMKAQGIPNAAIYDRGGKYIEYREADTSCNSGLFKFIPELNVNGTYNKPDSLALDHQLKKFKDPKGNDLKEIEKADFYLLIYWAAWTGKLNKDHVKVWENMARENKNCSIKVIKVNLDVQEHWDKNERDKIMQAMNKKK